MFRHQTGYDGVGKKTDRMEDGWAGQLGIDSHHGMIAWVIESAENLNMFICNRSQR